ncbi:MAG: PaaI family thioesterase [Halothermotrichaceae bacterium]
MYDMCFACGNDNPISLRLKFEKVADNKVEAEFIPKPVHQGYEGIIHGGIVSTLLDEAMVTAVIVQDVEAVTAEINIRFKEEIIVGEKLKIMGYTKGGKGRLVFTEGVIKNSNGKIKAKAKAKFMKTG